MKKQIIELITKLIVMSGLKLAGWQAWLVSIFAKKAVKVIVDQGEKVVDNIQNAHAEKVLNNPESTQSQKEKAAKEILEGK